MKRFVRQIITLLVVAVGIICGNAYGQIWYETATIIPGEEYLIGLVNGNNVYLAVNYAPTPSNYYTSANGANWYGYTVKGQLDGTNLVGIETNYGVDNLVYCTWIFEGNLQDGYIIHSARENYYLASWSSTSYEDLYPASYSSNATKWIYQNKAFYRTVGNVKRYMQYYNLTSTSYAGPHMRVTGTPQTNNIKLYTKDFPLPITLLDFYAIPRENFNQLTIVTGYEYNNCEFIVYRSEDAINWDYDNPVCDWDFGKDSAIYNEVLDSTINYFTIEHPNGQTYYPIDYHPYDTTYYKLVQRDCDGRLTEYTSDIIVCFREPKLAVNKPNAYYDNGIVLSAGDYLTDAYIYTMTGAQRYTIRLKPGQTKRVNYYGLYIVELIWVVDGDIQRKVEKIIDF